MDNGGLNRSQQDLHILIHAVLYDKPKWQVDALKYFNDADAFRKHFDDFLAYQHCKPDVIATLKSRLNRILEQVTPHESYGIMYRGDVNYPALLNEIADPPLLLYYRGDITHLTKPQIAVVGPRTPSHYGQQVTTQFCDTLRDHYCIVSGMAFGVDKLAHESAIKGVNGTIAVLGSAVDCPYPKSNERLYNTLCESHLVLSEYPPGTPPLPHHFPQRNRIVAGLSVGVLLPEAKLKSGSMITARLAMEFNREVWCVPGSVLGPHAAGCHSLIQDGAALVTSPSEIMPSSTAQQTTRIAAPELPLCPQGIPNALWTVISAEPTHISEILSASGLPIQDILSALTLLILQNKVTEFPGQYFAKS
ncbi:MAG: DNA-processing protein DprA [bacterium]|nr:DNA-processing protein DprA [bacterium]